MAVLIILFLLRYVLLLTFDNMLSALDKNYEAFADFSSEIAISRRAWQPHKLRHILAHPIVLTQF